MKRSGYGYDEDIGLGRFGVGFEAPGVYCRLYEYIELRLDDVDFARIYRVYRALYYIYAVYIEASVRKKCRRRQADVAQTYDTYLFYTFCHAHLLFGGDIIFYSYFKELFESFRDPFGSLPVAIGVVSLRHLFVTFSVA